MALAGQVLGRRDPAGLVLIWHDSHSNIVDVITRRNNRTFALFQGLGQREVLETYITSLGHVYDPHTDYYDKSDLDNFAIEMTKTLFGIGATLISMTRLYDHHGPDPIRPGPPRARNQGGMTALLGSPKDQ